MATSFICSVCGETKPVQTAELPGYGQDAQKRPVCYACCAIRDKRDMMRTGKATMYLTRFDGYDVRGDEPLGTIGNWPGTLKFPVFKVKRSTHNLSRYRYDFWFTVEGAPWHGVQYGDNTQIAHCRRVKASR